MKTESSFFKYIYQFMKHQVEIESRGPIHATQTQCHTPPYASLMEVSFISFYTLQCVILPKI